MGGVFHFPAELFKVFLVKRKRNAPLIGGMQGKYAAPSSHLKIRRLRYAFHNSLFKFRGDNYAVYQGPGFFKPGYRTQSKKPVLVGQAHLLGPLYKNLGKLQVCQALVQSPGDIVIRYAKNAGIFIPHNRS